MSFSEKPGNELCLQTFLFMVWQLQILQEIFDTKMRKYVADCLVLTLCLFIGCFCSRSNNGKEGIWGKKKKGFCCSFAQIFSRVPLQSELYLSWYFSPPLLPNSSSIQHSELEPLIFACSPARTSYIPVPSPSPPFFPRCWVLVWELLFPLDFSSWHPICKILWPKGSHSPDAVILILLHGASVNSE